MHQLVTLPPAARVTVLPPEGGPFALDYEISHAEPSAFSPLDPDDDDTLSFDWSRRGYIGDTIISASVTSVPTGLNLLGAAVINGPLVEIEVGPFVAAAVTLLPAQFALRCVAVFASGRISNFSVPVQIKSL